MTEIIRIKIEDIIPEQKEVLLNQGITSDVVLEDKIQNILDQAMKEFRSLAEPSGIIKDIPKEDFARIYIGEGMNEGPTPVADVYPGADYLALFAVTLGERISDRINHCFKTNLFAEGCMLDAAASAGADHGAEILQRRYEKQLSDKYDDISKIGALRYSPGYCGWHISGQKKLFESLEPEKIGITLRETYLMDPLKSVSGVIIAGPKEIHQFENNYPCCEECDDQSCLDRMQALKNE
ncbi:MAG: hypothetical protein GF310_11565 [candidate division Zixibacteria bacterium]|nr:hypothetical protein [candidate division Zixibacteria bacterium]